jgi:hypothetical protein
MSEAFIRGFRLECENSRTSSSKTDAGRFRLLALHLFVLGILSISGCTAVTGTTNTSGQQNQITTATAAAISLSPPSVSFGPVAVGNTVSQSITVSNTGGSDLFITQASVAAQGITVSGISLPMTVSAGAQSTFDVVFSPIATGNVSGAVSVLSNASSSPATVAFNGSGVPATFLLDASSTSLNFENVTTGSRSVRGVTLTNTGNSNISVSNVDVSGAGFTASGVSTGQILTPGQTAALNVTFTPAAAASVAGSVTLTSNATNSPATISLLGAGAQPGPHSVTLNWTASTSAVAGYNVYQSAVFGGPYTELNPSAITSTSYVDSTVQAGQDYYYVVTSVALDVATSVSVESSYSDQVLATVPTP